MRHDIRIQAQPAADGGPVVFSISFSYPDRVKAKAAVQELAAKFTEMNAINNRVKADAYRGFWGDWQAKAAFDHMKTAATPPPPAGESVRILDPAGAPKESGQNHIRFLAWGLGVGLLLGLLAAFAMRRPHRARQLAGFAAAGCVLAGVASFLIPNLRYTSTAVMMVSPAIITEDPLTPLPASDFGCRVPAPNGAGGVESSASVGYHPGPQDRSVFERAREDEYRRSRTAHADQ